MSLYSLAGWAIAIAIVVYFSDDGNCENRRIQLLPKSGIWEVLVLHDRFEPDTRYIRADGVRRNSQLTIGHQPGCHDCTDLTKYSIMFSTGARLNCPQRIKNELTGQIEEKVFATWRVDNGTVHRQLYRQSLGSDSIFYFWIIDSTEPARSISKYPTIDEYYGTNYGMTTRVISVGRLFRTLADGNTLYIRISDFCESIDLEYSLSGFGAALKAANIPIPAR